MPIVIPWVVPQGVLHCLDQSYIDLIVFFIA